MLKFPLFQTIYQYELIPHTLDNHLILLNYSLL